MRKSYSDGAETYRAIHAAAVELIYQYGYNGTSMRRLAAQVGIDQSTLYYHIKSKQNLLYRIHIDVRDEYMSGLNEALAVADPEEQMRRFIRYHVRFRFRLRKMSFITATELRGLTPARRKTTMAVQSMVLAKVKEVIDRGLQAGIFDVADSRIAALAIFQLLNGINAWYSPRGRHSEDKVIEMHTQFVLGLLRSGRFHGKLSHPIDLNGDLTDR